MQPVQLRLGFTEPDAPIAVALSLSGLRVYVESSDPRLAFGYLTTAGLQPSREDGPGISFPVTRLAQLVNLPEQVSVHSGPALATLVRYVQSPPPDGTPALLTALPNKTLWLQWFDGITQQDEPIPGEAIPAFLAADLPYKATEPAQRLLGGITNLPKMPMSTARARVHHDGYIELQTSKPQMLEKSDLPGLFRLDDELRFGMPLAYADVISNTPGFTWSSPPVIDHGPTLLPTLPMTLSTHAAGDLRRLVENLSAYRAQAIVWGSGLGRRVFSLAALDALDAWPVLVVCTPATVWAWQRHLELFGRTVSLTHHEADAQLITYDELALKRAPTGPQAIIFDSIGDPTVLTGRNLRALRRLDSLTDAYRVAISTQWPSDPRKIVNVMSVLRPAEFAPDEPLTSRYPGNAEERFRQHVNTYITARNADSPGNDTRAFRRSTVVDMPLLDDQRVALRSAIELHGHNSPDALLVAALEINSWGTDTVTSPKIAEVASRAKVLLAAGRRVAVLTRWGHTASLLHLLVRAQSASTIEASVARAAGIPSAQFVVVRYDRELPDLRAFTDVLVLDIPWSWATLDRAVGSPVSETGPVSVMVFHINGSVDDRIALMAARRKQLGSVIDQEAPPDASEKSFLLEVVRSMG